MILAIVLVALVAGSHASMVSYEGYKVFRITPHTIHQQRVLENLKKTNNFDVWKSSPNVSQSWDIMVEPKLLKSFESTLVLNKIDYKVLIQNVEASFSHNISSDLSKSGLISFQQYNDYETIVSNLKTIAAQYPEIATFVNIGQSYEGRDIPSLKISSGGSNKPAILVDGGLHANEWLTPAQGLYIIQELVENPANAHMIKNVDWYIIPVLNVDGYQYSLSTEPYWSKTRSKGLYCIGVDASLNFGFHWFEAGISSSECDQNWPGSRAFTEPEVRAVRNFAHEIGNVKLYISLHSYGEYILYPWGYTSDYPDNADELQRLGEAVSEAIRNVRETEYTVGSFANVLPAASGNSADWMMAKEGIPLAFTLYLPGIGGGYRPPPWFIEGLVSETFEGFRVFQQYVEEQYVRAK